MKVSVSIATAITLCSISICAFGQFHDVCNTHDWSVINSESERKSSLLCQGVADLSLGRPEQGRKILLRVIDQAPQSDAAYEAHERLLGLYARSGHMREASHEMTALLTMKPDEPDVRNESSLFEAFGRFPDMKVSHRRPTSFSKKQTSGILNIPFSVGSHAATFFLDTGADFSVISDKEARALGLTITAVDSTIQDSAGLNSKVQITEIGKLTIGPIRLEHIPFLVLSASQEPFSDITVDTQGLLGIQVALALQTISLGVDGHVDLAFMASTPPNAIKLTFDDAMPVVHVTYLDKMTPFTFDTGAEHSTLNPPFLHGFPQVAETGVQKSHTMEGVNGSVDARSIQLPMWQVNLGGRTATVSNMPILLQNTTGGGEWAVGNLGLDILKQVEPFTIDFKGMQLVIVSVDGH